jgi:hypothetical protein
MAFDEEADEEAEDFATLQFVRPEQSRGASNQHCAASTSFD